MWIPLKKIGAILNSCLETTLNVNSFAIDSRLVKPGGLFFALKGERVDGHDFLMEVSSKGGYAAVVDKNYKGSSYNLDLIFVENVKDALQTLARKMIEEKKMRVIGVTGSTGKTTTKEMIYHILSMKYKVHTSPGNYNTQVSLPLTVLEANGDEDFLLLEMAMTKKGHIRNLVCIAPPEIIVLTPITYCHSENFSCLEDIAEAKAEIFTPKAKYAVIHVDNIRFNAVYRNCFCDNILYPSNINLVLPFKEKHFNDNFIAAYEVAKYLGMSEDQIRLASLGLLSKKSPHRFEKIYRDGILFIDDSYNANVLSITAALKSIPQPENEGRKIFVFGEMRELGSMSKVSHSIVTEESLKTVDIALCIGRETKQMVEAFEKEGKIAIYHYDYKTLKENLFKIARRDDIVLLKGANSHSLWRLLETSPASI